MGSIPIRHSMKLNVGDKVKAARQFRNTDFRFDGEKKIVDIGYYDEEPSYILEGMPSVLYYKRDLILVR